MENENTEQPGFNPEDVDVSNMSVEDIIDAAASGQVPQDSVEGSDETTEEPNEQETQDSVDTEQPEKEEETEAEPSEEEDNQKEEEPSKQADDELNRLKALLEEKDAQFKNLQSDYTRKAQELSEAKQQAERKVETEVEPEQDAEYTEVLQELEKSSPDLAKFLKKHGEVTQKKAQAAYEKEIATLRDGIAKQQLERAAQQLDTQVDKALDGKYAGLQAEFSEVFNTLYPTDEVLTKALSNGEDVYGKLELHVRAKYPAKVAEAEKPKEKVDDSRKKEIQKAKGATNTRKASPSSKPKDIRKMTKEDIAKLSVEEHEKLVDKALEW